MEGSIVFVTTQAELTQALENVRQLRSAGKKQPVTIRLTEDLYLSCPVLLDVEGVTLDGCGHKLIGGIPVDNWQPDTFRGVPCCSAQLPAGTWDFTDLWVDDRRADPIRFPQAGYLEALAVERDCSTELMDGSRWFAADPAQLAELDNIEQAVVNFVHFWVDEHSPVESYDSATGKLTMRYPSRFRIDTRKNDHGQMRWYLTNVPSAFGAENQWYLDPAAGKLYYKGKVSMALVPTLENLLIVTADKVCIRNAELTCTRGDYVSRKKNVDDETLPEHGYGADPQSVCWAPGAVVFENVTGCVMADCFLHGTGLYGVEIRNGCHDIRIENNRLTDLGAGGVKIVGGAYGEAPEKMTTHCTVRGNEIDRCGCRYDAGCGVLAMHTSHLTVEENHIHHTGYTGISVGWVWGYEESSSYGNRILRNHIHHIGTGSLSDMGGIYLLGPQPGTVVSENRIHDVIFDHYGGWGIYTDEGSSGIVIENNVVFRTQCVSFHQHYGRENLVRNNIFALGAGCVRVDRQEDHVTAVLENNIYLTDGQFTYPKRAGRNTFRSARNVFWDLAGEAKPTEEDTLETWQEKGKDVGSILADPLFMDVQRGDFTLQPDSPAIALGFRPISGFPAKEG